MLRVLANQVNVVEQTQGDPLFRARVIATLLNVGVKLIEAGDHEERLAAVEAQLAETGAKL